jgi:Cation transporter/ATPase, N-terminus
MGMENPWTKEVDDIATELNVDLHTGLTQDQVTNRLDRYGKNGIFPYLSAPW